MKSYPVLGRLQHQDFDTYLRTHSVKIEGGKVQCRLCGKVTAHSGNMRQHFIIHHVQEDVELSCPYCEAGVNKFKNRNSLNCHISQKHRGQTLTSYRY